MENVNTPLKQDDIMETTTPPPSPKSDSSGSEPDGTFTQEIIKLLTEKKKLSPVSIQVYLRNLKKLNLNKPLEKDFKFLEDLSTTEKFLADFKNTTKRNYLISIVSILSVFTDDAKLKTLHDSYHDLMMQKKSEIAEVDSAGTRSETQEENWVNWDEVKAEHSKLAERVEEFYKKKAGTLTGTEFEVLTAYLILSLYCLIPPRRNKDYCLMRVVTNFTPELDTAFNYYDLTKKKFIFLNYKTSKKYGRFDYTIPRKTGLQSVINKYLKHRTVKFPLDDNDNKNFLIKPDGKPLDKSNDITKVLNKVFGKAIGSSMLRHIFLSDKYSAVFKESKLDSLVMAHSETEQKRYIKEKLTVVL
jgi:hypothetical protein